ncbi:protoporphyrinogen oxidase [Mycobacterium tuberculosis]|nr:protoporphyrinogen oxidase [Mycobacterium tuberculosis]
MTPRSYCVVGGGISGLTSAYRLRQAVGDDATITLFEPADRLGGVLRTEHIGGQPMDLGAEAFVLRRPEMPALLAELGLSDRQLASTGARPLIYSQQRLHPLPPQTVVGIPSSAGSMAGLVDDATLARIDAEAARPFTWQVGSDPAVADLVADRFGDQVVARSVALAVPGGTAFPHCSGVLVAGDESPHAKAITLSSRKWGQRGDVALLRLSFGRFGDEPALTASDDQLLAWAADDLVTVFGVAVDPVDVRVRRWIEAMPQYGPGHADVVAELRAGLPPTLAVAGSYLDGIGVPACVGAAGRAVTSVIEALDAQVAR